MLESLGNQTLLPDAIYLNVPYTNKRTGEAYVIPTFLDNWPRLIINRFETDYGSLSKLVPVLTKETDPDTIIITVDDDRLYKPQTISYLAWHSEHDSNIAWGLSGWSFMWYDLPRGLFIGYI